MKLHLPTYLGSMEVEIDTDGIDDNEEVIGWIDEMGTIRSSKANVIIGDVVAVKHSEYSVLVMRKNADA